MPRGAAAAAKRCATGQKHRRGARDQHQPGSAHGGCTRGLAHAAMKAFLRRVERSMANSWRLPKRYPLGEVGFLDTDFFKGRIQKALPPEVLGRPLTNVADAPARLVAAFGERATVGDVLALDLAALARKSGMTVKQVAEARAHLLRTHASAAPTRG